MCSGLCPDVPVSALAHRPLLLWQALCLCAEDCPPARFLLLLQEGQTKPSGKT